MKVTAERPRILIVIGYHPKETFAIDVGEHLLQNAPAPDVKVVRYTGKPDRKTSTYNLRRFIEEFDPLISPIILHSDDDLETDAAIIYCAKSRQMKRRVRKPLLDFCFKHSEGDDLVVWGRFLIHNTKCSLIDIELNSKMGFKKSVNLVESFYKYLLSLYFEKRIKL